MASDEQGDDFYNVLCDLTDGDHQDILALFGTSSKEPAANPTSLYAMTAQAGYDDPTGSECMLGVDLAFPGNELPLVDETQQPLSLSSDLSSNGDPDLSQKIWNGRYKNYRLDKHYGQQRHVSQNQQYQDAGSAALFDNSGAYQDQVANPTDFLGQYWYPQIVGDLELPGDSHTGGQEAVPDATLLGSSSPTRPQAALSSHEPASTKETPLIGVQNSFVGSSIKEAPMKEHPIRQGKQACSEIRMADGGLEWRESSGDEWISAIYHSQIWSRLLGYADDIAERRGGYDVEPARGAEEWNRTAFCETQQHWGMERDYRPNVLFCIQKTAVPTKPKPRTWYWDGRIVIDRDNQGMRWFDDLPVTISSAIEGARLDAIQKLNPEIEWVDIVGRMPDKFQQHGKIRGVLSIPALSNKTLRFCRRAGILSWDRRDDLVQEVTLKYYRRVMGDACIEENNTQEFGRDLSLEEVRQLEGLLEAQKPIRQQARGDAAQATFISSNMPQHDDPRIGKSITQNTLSYYGSQGGGLSPRDQPAIHHQALCGQSQASHKQRAPTVNDAYSTQEKTYQPAIEAHQAGQSSSSNRFLSTKARQDRNKYLRISNTPINLDPSSEIPNENGKRGREVVGVDEQHAPATKRPRILKSVHTPRSLQGIYEDTAPGDEGQTPLHEYAQVTHSAYLQDETENLQVQQPRPLNPLKRSKVLAPNRKLGHQRTPDRVLESLPGSPFRSTRNLQERSHPGQLGRKRDRGSTEEEDHEDTGNQGSKRRCVLTADVLPCPRTRSNRRRQQPTVYPRLQRCAQGPTSAAQSPKPTGPSNYKVTMSVPSGFIPLAVPVNSRVTVDAPNQPYLKTATVKSGQIDWQRIQRPFAQASAASNKSARSPGFVEEPSDIKKPEIAARSDGVHLKSPGLGEKAVRENIAHSSSTMEGDLSLELFGFQYPPADEDPTNVTQTGERLSGGKAEHSNHLPADGQRPSRAGGGELDGQPSHPSLSQNAKAILPAVGKVCDDPAASGDLTAGPQPTSDISSIDQLGTLSNAEGDRNHVGNAASEASDTDLDDLFEGDDVMPELEEL